VISSRLPAVSAAAVAALLLTSCAGEPQQVVGIDSLTVATLGAVTPAQQAFIDRLRELSEGSISVDLQENWQPSGGDSGSDEEALTTAVASGDVDVAWVTMRSLTAIGITGVDAIEAPLLIQTHAQQREVATGLAGEMMMRQLRETDIEGLAMLPGPQQFPVASGAPLLDIADWVGKTVEYAPGSNPDSVAALTISAFGATPSADGSAPVPDVVSGSVQAATANPADMAVGGATEAGPYLTANLPLWPQMSAIVMNRTVYERLSTRQSGFIEAAVERAQDLAMTPPDLTTPVTEACAAGVRFAIASADQVAAYQAAVQPIYDQLKADKEEGKIFDAIFEAVTRTVGVGSFPVAKACRWVAPAA
jgi:TRAP-type C4-dicarboxylate transport system substrate-binding protein